MAVTQVTEKKVIRVIDPSNWENPVFLAWVNKKGGWEFQLFNGAYEEKDKVNSESITQNREGFVDFEPYRFDVEYIQAWSHVLNREIQQGMTVSAEDITEDDRNRIRGIVHSPMVVYLKNPATWDTVDGSGTPIGCVWERVFIDGSLYDFGNPGQGSYDISLAIKTQPLITLDR